MIYGGTGYTGRMVAAQAEAAGLDPVIAGRNEETVTSLATELGLEYRVFGLDEPAAIDDALSGIGVLLNCAGPYARTAEPSMTAAIRTGTHYLDVAAELDSYQLAQELEHEAVAAGIMLLPGSGGSVAMLGCLAAHAARRIDGDIDHIGIALHVAGSMSRGSAVSASENLTVQCLHRVGGELVEQDPQLTRLFDFGDGPTVCFPATLPDLISLSRSTNAPNIDTYVHVSGDAFPEGDLAALPDGPTDQEREANRYQASVVATGTSGQVARAVLDTVNGYTFTPVAAVEAARRVLGGEQRSGFQTPAGLFGYRFAETIADTRIIGQR
ncbi:saccharopine dehydrogenase NADP-binding domain-containing protein [Rhodococcus fascians]|nr:saccharopine dehydrogenase NADP-binding domain-containing protein [Rhodococcus fascians]MBY3998506.1 saccharopine dehydrogenase NADP-binding domain-containing protein [Rhodococcus fascians]MBY4004500.1 saccharopine dehydrogenase NADP-binding domain-containing protein [Rhodococcus fascians]MBY4009319.1 saccharopine dehydrogenase NADP-binding domain-containing protein [Rhodococcus fascians]MBY4019707.1 saccharopine dehydrogenase NADP-binding domain-containing protein [Rhodococcus fascians]